MLPEEEEDSDDIDTPPLDPCKLVPETREIEPPPRFVERSFPADKEIEPPIPLPLCPIEIEISPEFPLTLLPVETSIEPLDPVESCVSRSIDPPCPDVPEPVAI
jgi:hypothetical protein